MRKKKDVFNVRLDPEEKQMLASLERGEWKPIPKNEEIKMRKNVQQAAANYLRRKKEERISIRVFREDLKELKARAKDEGLPYQTLVTSILHKYTTGKFIENRNSLK